MILPPESVNLGDLLYRRTPFRVPKYQRAYAWEEREITDYVGDINKAVTMLRMGKPEMHFFGGLVTVFDEIPGGNFEVVDGQQRLSTFMITISLLARAYKLINEEADNNNDTATAEVAKSKYETIRDDYMYLKHTLPGKGVELKLRLELSRADKDYFNQLVSLDMPKSPLSHDARQSHYRLNQALNYISDKLFQPILTKQAPLQNRLEHLSSLEDAILNYCCLILIKSNDRREAYKLFAILNDRGKKLHDGDLLRLYTLELLENYPSHQTHVEQCWDEILWYEDNEIDGFLRAYYPSHLGDRAPSRDLADEYLKKFFFESPITIDASKADQIRDSLQNMKEESEVYYLIAEGRWPYGENPKRSWDRDRLKRLIKVLKHSVCIPLLLSASRYLDEATFAELVFLIERFSFRYITVVGAHAGRLGSIYNDHAKKIRKEKASYKLSELKVKLQALQQERASDALFSAGIEEKLTYQNSSMRVIIRYMLTTIEDYLKDIQAQKLNPKPEKIRVFDLDQTTIEHIYPQNPSIVHKDDDLEPLINNVGNLSILIPEDNMDLGNNPFLIKKSEYAESSLRMNQELGILPIWNKQALLDRRDRIIEMAKTIFTV